MENGALLTLTYISSSDNFGEFFKVFDVHNIIIDMVGAGPVCYERAGPHVLILLI